MAKHYSVAIDGPAGAGKSTIAKALARDLGLLESGGSDFHGDRKPSISLGTGRGELRVPESVLDGLRAAINN